LCRGFLGSESIEGFKLDYSWADSAIARCIGKPSYLEPISGSMHVSIEGEVAIGEKTVQGNVENTNLFGSY
jgi:hypothetical protein